MPRPAKFEEYEFGASWIQSEPMARASHAIKVGGGAWLIDPVDSPGDIVRAVGNSEPVAVIQLLDRHNRDCVAVAERYEVPLYRLPRELPDCPLTPFSVLDRPKWRETALWWPEHRALVVTEALMTVPDLAIGETGIAIHPMLRLTPPGALRRYTDVDHLLTGHGMPQHGDDLGARIQDALDQSRKGFPHLLTRMPKLIKAARS
jgi:hypothetical protein